MVTVICGGIGGIGEGNGCSVVTPTRKYYVKLPLEHLAVWIIWHKELQSVIRPFEYRKKLPNQRIDWKKI